MADDISPWGVVTLYRPPTDAEAAAALAEDGVIPRRVVDTGHGFAPDGRICMASRADADKLAATLRAAGLQAEATTPTTPTYAAWMGEHGLEVVERARALLPE